MAIKERYNDSGANGVVTTVHTVEVKAADAANDVIFIAPLSGSLIPLTSVAYTAGVTGLTSADLGFYESATLGGSVLDKDALAAAVDLSASGSDDMLAALTVANRGKTVEELVGGTKTDRSEYVLALTLNTDPTADGVVVIETVWSQG